MMKQGVLKSDTSYIKIYILMMNIVCEEFICFIPQVLILMTRACSLSVVVFANPIYIL